LTLCSLPLHNHPKFAAGRGEEIHVPKTLLAVDDSATMRRVLEITFSGEDYQVITAEGAQSALGKLNQEPRVVLIDTSLGQDDGYALCKEIRRRDASAALILLSSRHNPYDQTKGRDAGADDYMDKPFDTQQMIEKVRKVLLAREGGAQPGVATTAAAQAPAVAMPAAAAGRPASFTPQAPVSKPPVAPARGHTLMFGESGTPAAPPVAPSPSPGPVGGHPQAPGPVRPPQATSPQSFMPRPPPAAAKPVDAPVHAAPPPQAVTSPAPPPIATPAATPAAAARSAVAQATNGHLASKLGDLGLTPAQVEGVLALSREVVERVVWEVVPQLAETIIKEEIARLTKEA
jgi:CheY-like chemotaxis protein